jgi:hypothetical protein
MRRSSAGMAVRALVMLACVVGIPAAAMSGTSWSQIVKKFQGFRLPAILSSALASTSLVPDKAVPAVSPVPKRSGAHQADPPHVPARPSAIPADRAATADRQSREIQDRLRHLGATYYVLEVLEAWGQQPNVYRFFCKMAVNGNAEFTRCFEATKGDPTQAMADVLQQVEHWRVQQTPGEPGTRG